MTLSRQDPLRLPSEGPQRAGLGLRNAGVFSFEGRAPGGAATKNEVQGLHAEPPRAGLRRPRREAVPEARKESE